jgi:L-alanine-DL-glutamate epimerase-like enolase superfamily enzyme
LRITSIKTGTISIPLRTPFKTSLRTVNRIISTVVLIETDAGISGIGEAHPTAQITGESPASVRSAIHEFIFPRISNCNVCNLEETSNRIADAITGNPSAKAAVEMAVYDLFGKYYQIPVYRLLGGYRNQVETDLTISVNSPAQMAADSCTAVERGFRILKLKVGLDPAQDIARINAVKNACGDGILLRLDANQGWNTGEAIRIMRTVEAQTGNIDLLEQPVAADDLEGLRTVKNSITTPVLADESVFSPADANRIITANAADFINIKLMKSGGLRAAQQICTLAETSRRECFIGCMMESKIGITAAAHLACGKSIITRCDLDSPALCSEDPVIGGVTMDGPWLKVSEAPGLGIEHVEGICWDNPHC